MNFPLKRKFLFVALVAFVAWFLYGTYVGLTHVEIGENVPSVNWLPDAASNVSFYKSYSFTSYEFDIPESDFVKWSRWELSPIDEPVSIPRYCYSSVDVPAPGPNATAEEWQAFESSYASRSAKITNGLYYGYLQGNGGGVWVGYDRNLGRAYYHSAPR